MLWHRRRATCVRAPGLPRHKCHSRLRLAIDIDDGLIDRQPLRSMDGRRVSPAKPWRARASASFIGSKAIRRPSTSASIRIRGPAPTKVRRSLTFSTVATVPLMTPSSSSRARNRIRLPRARRISVAWPEGVAALNATSLPAINPAALRRSRISREIALTAAFDLARSEPTNSGFALRPIRRVGDRGDGCLDARASMTRPRLAKALSAMLARPAPKAELLRAPNLSSPNNRYRPRVCFHCAGDKTKPWPRSDSLQLLVVAHQDELGSGLSDRP